MNKTIKLITETKKLNAIDSATRFRASSSVFAIAIEVS
jgi:hypothetical protein